MKGSTEVQGWKKPPQLVVPYEVWQKIIAYARSCPAEINGFGMVERRDNLLVVEDVFITKQHVTAGSADVSAQDVHELLYRMTREGHDTGKLRLQWHSHVDMPAYFSPTDTRNIEGYSGDWMVSLVVNRRGEFDCRLDVFKPFRFGNTIHVLIGMPPVDSDLAAQCQEEIEEHVTVSGWLRRRGAEAERPDSIPGGDIPASSAFGESRRRL